MQRPKPVRRRVVLALALALFPILSGVVPAGADGATTYYLDTAAGSDDNAGRSPGTAWRSLDKVDATTFDPGDRVLLRGGRSWQGQLWPKGSGTQNRPIVLGANLRDLRGIHVSGDSGQQLSGFHINSVDMHDVTGEVNWIGGNTSGNAPGITVRTDVRGGLVGRHVDARPDAGAFEYRHRT